MVHPLVDQLRFTRTEFVRAMEGVTAAEATQRFMPINCLSWMVAHLASQEQNYWLLMAQGADKVIDLQVNELAGYGQPASTPDWEYSWQVWRKVTHAADDYLEQLNPAVLQTHFIYKDKPWRETVGTMLWRNIHHYWFHIGESQAVRQLLGHTNLPTFVGNLSENPYRPE